MSYQKTLNHGISNPEAGCPLERWVRFMLVSILVAVAMAVGGGAAYAAGKKALTAEDIERARAYFTDTEMSTHKGDKVRFYSDMLDDRVVAINVMYTNCKGACPMTTQKLLAVKRELGDLFGKDVFFVSVSNDAERDVPEALADFADKQGANIDGWTFLTGDKNQVDNVLKKIGLYESNFEQHKSLMLLGNTRTGHWQKVRPDVPHQAVAAKLKELAGEG